MKVKIAVASTDGKVVNEQFGVAKSFHIFEIGVKNYKYLETRKIDSCCGNENCPNAALDDVIEVIRDCIAVVAAKIGEGAGLYMGEKGFTVFEAPYLIDAVINKIIDDDLLEQ